MSSFKSVITVEKLSKCSPIVIKGIYIFFAMSFVCHGFYKTTMKLTDEQILIKEVQLDPKKVQYPSVTFCYKYKHGGKDVFGTYYRKFYWKWKKSGECGFAMTIIVYNKFKKIPRY